VLRGCRLAQPERVGKVMNLARAGRQGVDEAQTGAACKGTQDRSLKLGQILAERQHLP